MLPDIGLDYANISRVTMIWPVFPLSPPEAAPFILVSTRTPFNEVQLFKALGAVRADQMDRFGGMKREAYEEKTEPAKKSKNDNESPIVAELQPAVETVPQPNITPELYMMGGGASGILRIDSTTLLFLPVATGERATFTFFGSTIEERCCWSVVRRIAGVGPT